jgi:uncharacterized protein
LILLRQEPKTSICSQLEVAESYKTRLLGLIGTKELKDSGLWIPRCNWIHTFFMSIPIDVIYIDKKMTIKKIDHALKPWRMPLPVFSASSVIELEAGTADKLKLKIGEALNVGH